jgi:drug/metabolite transporter (DMT)-like permease
MVFYGIVIVAIGQLCWFRGLKTATPSEISLVNSFSPVIGILAAYLILGEQPTIAHWIGGTVIVGGLLLTQLGIYRKTLLKGAIQPLQPGEAEVGFKGL